MNKLGEPAAGAWQAWRAGQPEADDRDLDAAAAFSAGYAAGPGAPPRKTWHESLAAVLIALGILAAICYVLSAT